MCQQLVETDFGIVVHGDAGNAVVEGELAVFDEFQREYRGKYLGQRSRV